MFANLTDDLGGGECYQAPRIDRPGVVNEDQQGLSMENMDNQTATTTRPGEQLDHYRIEAMVAHDRGTTIFRATDLLMNRPVVIEIPDPEIEADPVLFERFQREEETGKALDHLGLIKVIEKRGGERGHGPPYMVKEWFDGVPLRELLSKGIFAPERAIRITVSICEAVEFVHNHGIVLLDIEPEHVLVGENDQVKLNHLGVTSKFGARRLTFTKLSQIVGASQYISPEELKGQRVDTRSDIYSIGLMLYEMLTGRMPFQGPGIYDRLARHLVPPREIDPSISPQLQEVIYRALERDPQNRYASAHEFARDLEHLDQVGVVERPELRDWKRPRSSQPRKILLYVAMALIPIVIFGLMIYFARR
jgi:serine/threonine-protein kinase